MPSIKTGQILGLSSQTVNIEDKTYLSEYFNLTEFSPEFSVGKNALVINGSDKLKIGAEILTEAFDGNGVPLFIEKAISTDQLTKKELLYFQFMFMNKIQLVLVKLFWFLQHQIIKQ
jgi:hypothetical protein